MGLVLQLSRVAKGCFLSPSPPPFIAFIFPSPLQLLRGPGVHLRQGRGRASKLSSPGCHCPQDIKPSSESPPRTLLFVSFIRTGFHGHPKVLGLLGK